MSEPLTDLRVGGMQVAEIDLPEELDRLYDLAYNLWWTWSPPVRQLFSAIDAPSWTRYRNPVELLLNVDRAQWERLVDDESFMTSYGRVVKAFDQYMKPQAETWFRREHPDYAGGPIAYFSMEYGIHQTLAIYGGGLGVLSGDHCKSASDLGLPFVGVGLLYRTGYFQQTVDADGYQQHTYPEYDFQRLPLRPAMDSRGRAVSVRVPFPGREVTARVWVAEVGRVPLLLLDTDRPENDPADRPITNALYIRGREVRLAQEVVLGCGGVKALAALGIEPAVWHINEGHSALLQLERARQEMNRSQTDFDGALETVGANVAFTTHTPVPAGNEQFDRDVAQRYLQPWAELLGTDTGRLLEIGHADHGEPGQAFNLTAFALKTSRFANGVSRLHAEVSDRMWRHLFPERPAERPVVEAITNGVHVPTWIGPEFRDLLRNRMGDGWLEALLDPRGWDAVLDCPDEELWAAHLAQKERLMRFTRSRLREQYARHGRSYDRLRELEQMFDPRALTIGFARRFATYKRAGLIFSDLHRLRQLLLNRDRPVRIFLAGKAHPADRPGQDLVRHIFKLSQEPDLKGRVVFLENYDMRVARMLVQGVDLWLNTPRRPQEASGTSGQKAAGNGVLNCSILDGWWPEGYDGDNGWAIGAAEASGSEDERDEADAFSLYHLLEEEIVPAYYERDEHDRPLEWIRRMKRAVASVGPRFSSDRMVRDYTELAYLPLSAEPGGAEAETAGSPQSQEV